MDSPVSLESFLVECRCKNFLSIFVQNQVIISDLPDLQEDEIEVLIPSLIPRRRFTKLLKKKISEGSFSKNNSQAEKVEIGKIDALEIVSRLKKQFSDDIKKKLDLYINPRASKDQEENSKMFEAIEHVNGFLENKNKKVMLILGDAGSGKSLFGSYLSLSLMKKGNFERKDGKEIDRIPMFIQLNEIENPDKKLLKKFLEDQLELTTKETRYARDNYPFLLFLDGFDEMKPEHRRNLYRLNLLGTMSNLKVIITCRTSALLFVAKGRNYKELFAPTNIDGYDFSSLDQIIIRPFSKGDIENYVSKYVKLHPKSWKKEKFLRVIKEEHLEKIVTNPFLMYISLESLNNLLGERKNRKNTKILRYHLFDSFVSGWFNREKVKRLKTKIFSQERILKLSQKLAFKMFEMNLKVFKYINYEEEEEEEGEREETNTIDSQWKEFFQKNIKKSEGSDILNCIPLGRIGEGKYKFLHKSIWEFFLASLIVSDLEKSDGIEKSIVHLNCRLLNDEISVVKFLSNVVRTNQSLQKNLFNVILLSRNRKDVSMSSANAATILNFSRVSFSHKDLHKVKIPGANLSNCVLFKTNLSGSNLSNCVLQNSIMENGNFESCNMNGVRFGENSYFNGMRGFVKSHCERFIITLEVGVVVVREMETFECFELLVQQGDIISLCKSSELLFAVVEWESKIVNIFNGGNEAKNFKNTKIQEKQGKYLLSIAWKPNTRVLAISIDNVVRLYDGDNEYKCFKVINDHEANVTGLGFHPNPNLGLMISADIKGGTFLWDLRNNFSKRILVPYEIVKDKLMLSWFSLIEKEKVIISFHPNVESKLIARGGVGINGLQIWDGNKDFSSIVIPFSSRVFCCEWHPNPSLRLIAASDDSGNIELIDGNQDYKKLTLKGHSKQVTSLSWHPNPTCFLLVSCSNDSSIRVWNGENGYKSIKMEGHIRKIRQVCWKSKISFSELISLGEDKTLRSWNLNYRNETPEYELHKGKLDSEEHGSIGCYIHHGSWIPNINLSLFVLWRYRSQEIFVVKGKEGYTNTKFEISAESIIWHPNSSSSLGAFYSFNKLGLIYFKNSSEIDVTNLSIQKGGSSFKKLCWYPDPNSFICAAIKESELVYLIDMKKNKVIMELNDHKKWVNTLCWHPDHKLSLLATGDESGTIIIWKFNFISNKFTNTILKDTHKLPITQLEFNPSSETITLASGSDRSYKSNIEVIIWTFNERKSEWKFKLIFCGIDCSGISKLSWHPSKTSFLLAINVIELGRSIYIVDVKNNCSTFPMIKHLAEGDFEWFPNSSRAIIAAVIKPHQKYQAYLRNFSNKLHIQFWEFSLSSLEKKKGKFLSQMVFNGMTIVQLKFLSGESTTKLCVYLENLCLRFYEVKLGERDITMILEHVSKPLLYCEGAKFNKCIISKKNSMLMKQKGALFDEIIECKESQEKKNEGEKSKGNNSSSVVFTHSNYEKFAFVVGNRNYSTLAKLKNPINDAKKVSGELKKLGFYVNETYTDLDSDDFFEEFDFFCSSVLDKTDEYNKNKILVVFFYAGHSVFFGTSECLLPIDFDRGLFKVEYTEKDISNIKGDYLSELLEKQKSQKRDIENFCLSRRKILHMLEIVGGKHLLFFDACRDLKEVSIVKVKEKKEYNNNNEEEIKIENENIEKVVETKTSSISSNKPSKTRSLDGKGIEIVKKLPSSNYIISFSTQRGEKSLDGDGNNSFYTKALCELLLKEEGKLLDLLSKVRNKVAKESSNNQTPEYENCSNDPNFFWPPERKEKID